MKPLKVYINPPKETYPLTPGVCPHDDWMIHGPEMRTNATCTKCGGEYALRFLMNNWKARIEREIKEALGQ